MRGMITNKQLQKAKELADLFEDYKKSNMSPTNFCKERGIHTSKFYYWKKRYESDGIAGLIDQRRGTSYKITEEERAFIQKTKIEDSFKSGRDIAEMTKKKFNMSITRQHINNILKELGLNDHVGRKTGKPIKKTRVTRI